MCNDRNVKLDKQIYPHLEAPKWMVAQKWPKQASADFNELKRKKKYVLFINIEEPSVKFRILSAGWRSSVTLVENV